MIARHISSLPFVVANLAVGACRLGMGRLGSPWVVALVSLQLLLGVAVACLYTWRSRRRQPTTVRAVVELNGRRSRRLCALLLLWRVANAGWTIGLLLFGGAAYPWAYTTWNFCVQPVFWVAASWASALHLRDPSHRSRAWPWLIQATHSMFEVLLPTAWLVTLVVFCILDPLNPHIFADPRHFWNTAALTCEFALNSLHVRGASVLLFACWPLLYVLCTWVHKAASTAWWPYGFLRMEDATALLWYPALFVANLLLFAVFVRCSRCKAQSHEGALGDDTTLATGCMTSGSQAGASSNPVIDCPAPERGDDDTIALAVIA